ALDEYEHVLNFEDIAIIWHGGCIIRAALLDDIAEACRENSKLANLMVAPNFSQELIGRQSSLREVIKKAAELGIPASGLTGALAYYDSYRSGRLPANLIQAQRDYFGSHTYERTDAKGTFHTQWNSNYQTDRYECTAKDPAGSHLYLRSGRRLNLAQAGSGPL